MSILISVVVVLAVAIAVLWFGNWNIGILRGIKVGVRLHPHAAVLAKQCPVMPVLSDAEANALPINVTRWGETGAGMVIIHGGVQGNLGGGPSTFDAQQVLSKQGWRMMLPERPGFGKSPTRGPDDMEKDAVWIADMLDGVVLMGHSWGGAEALLAAARRPEGVRALIFVEPAFQPMFPRSSVMMRRDQARNDFLNFGESCLAAKTPIEYGHVFAGMLGEGTAAGDQIRNDPATAESLGCSILQSRMASPESMKAACAIIAREKIPVLTISGGWSPVFDAVSELGAELMNGKHVIVPSKNHFPQLENPEVFNKVIVDFVNAEAKKPAPRLQPAE